MIASTSDGISYSLVRSKRTTADIIIERDGTVLVRAPDWADDAKVREIVESRAYWIFQRLAEWRELNAPRVVREFENGESFLYLGRSYRLTIVDDQGVDVALRNGRFCVRRDLIFNRDGNAARDAIQMHLTLKALSKISSRVQYFAPKVGVNPRSCDVRDLGHRWASCSANGELAFHWKCMLAPLKIIDYVVVHELCHFHQRDHTEAFWNEVDKVLSDYAERKEWLRLNGAALDL